MCHNQNSMLSKENVLALWKFNVSTQIHLYALVILLHTAYFVDDTSKCRRTILCLISMQRHVGIVAEYDFLEFIMFILEVALYNYATCKTL